MRNQLLILLLLLIATQCINVTTKDSCDACEQFKSSSDCENYTGANCTWTDKTTSITGSCSVRVDPYVPYCSTIESSICYKQQGCAYLDSKCQQFSGCSAYAKTTTAECQSISYLCISDGKQCTYTLECKDYSKEQCQVTPSLYSPYKCKLDGDQCRAYKCDEAENTLTTDTACNAWLSGCVSTGQGCIATLPSCTAYTGTAATCPLMKGTEGICDFDSTAQKCKARECTGAPLTTIIDADCVKYKTGCVTTGKGCIASRGSCTSYAGNSSTCVGYIGTEGFCAGDATGTQCRARKCDEKTAITNKDCDDWKTGCVTNGKTCVTSPLGACSSYSGTTTSCEGYIGSDGNCKGTSTTSSPCAAKDCVTDSQGTETTDVQCQRIQSTCKTTGKGCAKTLSSCTTYSFTDDGTSCLSLVGLEGRCKAGTAGKCAVKLCTDAPNTVTTNKECNDFLTGCVTSGAGCVSQQTCTDVSIQQTCEGSSTNNCIWNATCVSNSSCSLFLNKSLCNGYKANNKPCIWDNGCKDARCSDFKGASDSICNELLTDCISNGTDCVDGTDCSKFQGVQATCEGFKAKCTNPTSVTDVTTPCVARTCDDAHLTFDNDTQCDNYKSGCVTKGTGCILGTSACSAYTGTPDQCDKFKGSSGTVRCWNTAASGNCVDKACTHATGMTDNTSCNIFLTGCLYDGNGSCVDKNASCSAYKGGSIIQCSVFKGDDGLNTCSWKAGNTCKTKECTDDTTSTTDLACGNFMTGCVTDGSGCVSKTQPCSSYSGTPTECKTFTGNKKTCTKQEEVQPVCKAKTCTNKTDALDNAACLSYHSSCRQSQGTNNCIAAPAACTGFNSFATGANDVQKQTYCNSVTDSTGNSCSYSSSSSTTCAVRACNLWVNTLTVACKDYNGNNSCVQNTNDNLCYTLGACSGYSIPGTLNTASTKATWCGAIADSNGKTCIYDQVADKCDVASATTICEQVYATDESECNKFLNVGTCKFYGSKCYTMEAACTSYSLTGITTGQAEYCSGHYQNSSGVFTKCAYDSGTTANCVEFTCSSIQNPTSQDDCNIGYECKYYGSKCYKRVACPSYTAVGANDAEKQLFCQNMYDGASQYFCSYNPVNSGTCADIKFCDSYKNLIAGDAGNALKCLGYRSMYGYICYYEKPTDVNCSNTSGQDICEKVPSPTSLTDCQNRTLDICHFDSSQQKCLQNTSCTEIDATGQDDKLKYCQNFKLQNNYYCTFDINSNCIDGKNSCADWNTLPLTEQLSYCLSRKDKNGKKCSWVSGAAACSDSDFICSDLTSPKSQADCDTVSAGCVYAPQTEKCIKKQSNCNVYTPTGDTDADKLKYCNSISSTTVGCTFIFGSANCITKAGCTTYTVSSVTDKIGACQSISTTNGAGCTYFAGTTCIVKVACASYTGGTTATIVNDCTKQTDTSAAKCYPAYGTGATSCIAAPANCEAITDVTSQAYCDIYVSGCIYSSTKNACLTPKSDCTYTYSGPAQQQFCSSLKNTLGDFCTADPNVNTLCKNRACNDTAASGFTTQQQCQTYSSQCKTNGVKCISIDLTCAQQLISESSCDQKYDTDGKSICDSDTQVQPSPNCVDFDCGQNVTATTDAECISLHQGCLTKGIGCISKAAPCNEYQGTNLTCPNFKGDGKKCAGDSQTQGACRDQICSDNITATNQSECESFLSGCIYNGLGCVDKSASCTAYKGTQSQCSNFKGVNNTEQCWGASTTTSGSCSVKKCSDKQSNSDTECNSFMPPVSPSTTPLCITDGIKCTENNQSCSFFKGNDQTCSQFTATDGICKASSQSTQPVSCTPRICSEAPNTYISDSQCETYQKGCKTNGRGCTTSVVCSDIQIQTACSAITGCLWANQCKTAPSTCAQQTSSGQSVCINTPLQNGKRCGWFNGTCRDQTCADYDTSLITHANCQSKDITCTTNGAGCVTLGACSTYRSKTVCESANTTDISKRCTWDSTINTCRQRNCSDGIYTTDEECDKFFSGCKTSGFVCIESQYGCNVFTGNPKKCLKNSSGQPCLLVNGICYDFDDCTDAPFTDLAICQKFSPQCVPDTQNCRAMTFCEKYENQVSCTLGVSSTTTPQICGWLPTGKCANFNNCSEAVGATLQDCLNWNSKCVSDGTKCVDQGNCATYGTEIACGNTGLDGLCKWAGTACRLRECGDNVAVTDVECQAYTVAAGVCTTDGTKCILRGTCSSYVTEASCTIGSDGIPCIFNFPIGTTTGTKSCRPMECSDIKGTSNNQCVQIIPNKACVSDGITCVKQDTCANYKNKISCKAGGSDGACAFTPAPTATNVNAGTCQLFKSCDAASKDEDTCKSKPQSCRWTSTIQGTNTTTSCVAMDCASAATGTYCVAVPNFDASSFTICVLTNGVCASGDPTTILQDQCYKSTQYSFTWNEATNKCTSCKGIKSNNSSGGITINNTIVETGHGDILGITTALAIIIGLIA